MVAAGDAALAWQVWMAQGLLAHVALVGVGKGVRPCCVSKMNAMRLRLVRASAQRPNIGRGSTHDTMPARCLPAPQRRMAAVRPDSNEEDEEDEA